jgi:hypothetical protein
MEKRNPRRNPIDKWIEWERRRSGNPGYATQNWLTGYSFFKPTKIGGWLTLAAGIASAVTLVSICVQQGDSLDLYSVLAVGSFSLLTIVSGLGLLRKASRNTEQHKSIKKK